MLTKRQILEAHLTRIPSENRTVPSRHEKDSASILSRVSRLLSKNSIEHGIDTSWPFHLIVYTIKGRISIFSGGWSKLIEVMPLKKDGHPDNRFKERGFLTPKGAVNFILRKLQ